LAAIAVTIFWIVCLAQLIRQLARREGHYEFPFFFVVTSTLYFGTQLALFTAQEGDQYSAEIAFFVAMAIGANFAVELGFRRGSRKVRESVAAAPHERIRVMPTFMLHAVLIGIAYYGFNKLADMSGSYSDFLSGTGRTITWEGDAVQYTFAIQNLYFVLPITLFLWRNQRKNVFLLLAIIAAVIPILNAAMLNRRFAFFLLAAIFYLFAYFQHRHVVSKMMLAVALPLGMLVVSVFPLLRGGGSLEDALTLRGMSGAAVVVGQQFGEVKNGVLALSATLANDQYEYGIGFPTQLFKDFVPSSLVGRETKAALIGPDTIRELVFRQYSHYIPTNEYITGISQSFAQLSFLSLLLWYAMGRAFGRVWARARGLRRLRDQILYSSMVPTGLMALYYDPSAALSQGIKAWAIIQLTFFFGRMALRTRKSRFQNVPRPLAASRDHGDHNPVPLET
jgi:hypothetical protein